MIVRRKQLFTMRVSAEEMLAFRRVAEAHGLEVAQVIRMLMKRAEASAAKGDPAVRAADAWIKASKAFEETGAAETKLRGIVVFGRHVQAVQDAVTELIAAARESDEQVVVELAGRFRAALGEFSQLHARPRAQYGLALADLFRAYGDVSFRMFVWLSRRAHGIQ